MKKNIIMCLLFYVASFITEIINPYIGVFGFTKGFELFFAMIIVVNVIGREKMIKNHPKNNIAKNDIINMVNMIYFSSVFLFIVDVLITIVLIICESTNGSLFNISNCPFFVAIILIVIANVFNFLQMKYGIRIGKCLKSKYFGNEKTLNIRHRINKGEHRKLNIQCIILFIISTIAGYMNFHEGYISFVIHFWYISLFGVYFGILRLSDNKIIKEYFGDYIRKMSDFVNSLKLKKIFIAILCFLKCYHIFVLVGLYCGNVEMGSKIFENYGVLMFIVSTVLEVLVVTSLSKRIWVEQVKNNSSDLIC